MLNNTLQTYFSAGANKLFDVRGLREDARDAKPAPGLDFALDLDFDLSLDEDGQVARSTSGTLSLALGEDAKAEANADAHTSGGNEASTSNDGVASVNDENGVAVVLTGAETKVEGPQTSGSVSNKAAAVVPGKGAASVTADSQTEAVSSGDGKVESTAETTACAHKQGRFKLACLNSQTRVNSDGTRRSRSRFAHRFFN